MLIYLQKYLQTLFIKNICQNTLLPPQMQDQRSNLIRNSYLQTQAIKIRIILRTIIHLKMSLEKTVFNAYLDPRYCYLTQTQITHDFDPLSTLLFQLYQLLIINGTPDKKKKMLHDLNTTLKQIQSISKSDISRSNKMLKKTLLSQFNHREASVIIKEQNVSLTALQYKYRSLIEDLESGQKVLDKQRVKNIGEGLILYVGDKIKKKNKGILLELAGRAFGYKARLSKHYLTNIYFFEDVGLYRFTAEFNKAEGIFYFLKEQIQYSINGQNADDLLRVNFSDFQVRTSGNINQSIVQFSINEDDESYLEESTVIQHKTSNNGYYDGLQYDDTKSVQINDSFLEFPLGQSLGKNELQLMEPVNLRKVISSEYENQSERNQSSTMKVEKIQNDQIIQGSYDRLGQIKPEIKICLLDKKQHIDTKESINMQDSAKSQQSTLKKFTESNPLIQSLKLTSMHLEKNLLHSNWRQKHIQKDLDEQDKIETLGESLRKFSKKSPLKSAGDKTQPLKNEIDVSINDSKRLKRKRSKSFELVESKQSMSPQKDKSTVKGESMSHWQIFDNNWSSTILQTILTKLIPSSRTLTQ